MRYFEFVHNLGIHSWDIPALIVAVILVVMILVHRHNQKKREKDFEEELDQKIQGPPRRTGQKTCTGSIIKGGNIYVIYF